MLMGKDMRREGTPSVGQVIENPVTGELLKVKSELPAGTGVPRRSMISLQWRGLNGNIDTEVRSGSKIHVHEFMRLDGVIDAPTWTFDYGFDPQMGETIGAVTERCRGILLGRTTYEMFEPAWSKRTVEGDPGRAPGRLRGRRHRQFG